MSEGSPQVPEMREIVDDSAEQFMPLASMRLLVEETLAPRFDKSGKLLPLEERRRLSNSEYLSKPLPSGERTDLVVPPKEIVVLEQGDDKIYLGYKYNVESALYEALTQTKIIALTASDIEILGKEKYALLQRLEGQGSYSGKIDNMTQINHAIYINSVPLEQPPPKDISGNIRVYLHGGIDGVRIARRMIEEGAEFDHAKVWTPDLFEGTQRFRRDTPIFEAVTTAQLQSIINTLRTLKEKGELPEIEREQQLVGLPVDGLPGIYVGQTTSGKSFNNKMRGLFGEPIHDAILATTAQTPFHAGEIPPEGWFERTALEARKRALKKASSVGVNTQSHALLNDQDPQPIVNILSKAA